MRIAQLKRVAALIGVGVLAVSCRLPEPSREPAPAAEPPAETTTTTTPPPARSAPAVLTPLLADVLAPPVPVTASDGRTHLAYELLVTNALPQQVALTGLTVLAGGPAAAAPTDDPAPTDDDAQRALLTLDADGLREQTRLVGGAEPTAVLAPGQTALVWLDVALGDADGTEDNGGPTRVPAELRHRLDYAVAHPQPPLVGERGTETVAVVAPEGAPVTVAPPVTGPSWVAVDGCCGLTGHRLAVPPLDGKLWAAERFAIDLVQLSPDGRLFAGDAARPENYPYFGTEVRAVADGPVVAVLDGLPDHTPGDPGPTPPGDAPGNHVVQDLGDGRYALYAHLASGSVGVRVGDTLRTGDVLGRLGNSGRSTWPHLHLQLMDAPDPLRANGIPFVFDEVRVTARLTGPDALGPLRAGEPAPLQSGVIARDRAATMPLTFDVMTWM